MYPSSSSSSSHNSIPSSSGGGLTRYVSAPGSLLTTAVDSVISGAHRDFASPHHAPPHPHPQLQRPPPAPSPFGQYFSADSSSVNSESTCKVNASKDDGGGGGLHRSFGFSDLTVGSGSSSSSPLVRQRSSPAGFLGQLTGDNAFSFTRGSGSSNGGHGVSRLKSQLSFTRQDSLSQISEGSENMVDRVGQENGHPSGSHSYATTSFGIDSWENANSIVFSAPPGKRAKNIDGDSYSFQPLETQFSLPQTTLEMATVEKLLQIPEDSVPCKIRAKRGCATHPRSIAERERRTRISGRLKKLQELVPNMDKQTSYSDMLDLAVQHIRTLQTQVQKLRQELDNCTCGCTQSS
ncbi:hypothetical protein CDL15_Pgr024750 [Punica granatum]|uniref:BHLH domain-containing protein n=1 Tax=Punica granatum TaxID=22663 RepID=A0A218W4G8_PUNGR|nr:hypothetical protein CDL15_Pgr024750 [Punica granatum]PKI52196.1 hypothetical protein CRG98_027371 [Punica granatum]